MAKKLKSKVRYGSDDRGAYAEYYLEVIDNLLKQFQLEPHKIIKASDIRFIGENDFAVIDDVYTHSSKPASVVINDKVYDAGSIYSSVRVRPDPPIKLNNNTIIKSLSDDIIYIMLHIAHHTGQYEWVKMYADYEDY